MKNKDALLVPLELPSGEKEEEEEPATPTFSSTFAPSSYSSPSSSVGYEPDSPQSVVDATESWSTLLEPGSFESADSAELWKADLSQLLIGHMFAAGSRSRIYRGIYKNRAVAVKMVKPLEHEDEEIRALLEKQFTCEVAMLSGLSHPNIVQFIAACRKPPVYCIITEYMSQGTLRTFLHKQEPFSLSLPRILAMALDISRGMKYIHSQGVIHRDLKSDNLLLNGNLRVKVADLGTSCFDKRRRVASKEGNPGTYRWMAPEMIKNKSCTRKVDVYSFGMVLWELTTALVPFQELTPVQAAYAACKKNLRPPLSDKSPPVVNNLITKCWSMSPRKRPNFDCIVAMLETIDQSLREGRPLPPTTPEHHRMCYWWCASKQ